MVLEFIIVILIGYLLGSIPFGLVIGKLTRGIDIRQYGSANIGFTNVIRTVGAKAGVVTLILDMAKGIFPAWLGGQIVGGDAVAAGEVTAALAAVAGHNWSIYLKFSGGKGVDTSAGGLLAMNVWVGMGTIIISSAIMIKTRYVSVGSMASAFIASILLIPLVILHSEPSEYLIYSTIMIVLIILRHRSNIANLRAGTEHKLGQKGVKR